MKDVPLPNSWWVTDDVLAGPTFFSGDLTTDVKNLASLESAGISTIVSLVSLDRYYTDQNELDIFAWAVVPRFTWWGLDIDKGMAPPREAMVLILQWIDVALMGKGKVYIHSHDGHGRTGAVVGCWLARHGIALGESVIDHIADLRHSFGLYSPSPETAEQRDVVIHWVLHQ